jgi:putative aldouronate transport system permease protein
MHCPAGGRKPSAEYLVQKRGEAMEKMKFQTLVLKDFKRYKYLYIMIFPVLLYYAIFCYKPMYGALMAFQDYNIAKGIWKSEWIGFYHFIEFFKSPYFLRCLRNTLVLNLYRLVFVFPAPIIFALLINEIKHKYFKKVIQTVSYLPYFISVVVISGIIYNFCMQNGLLTYFYKLATGFEGSVNLLTKPELFRAIYTGSDIWQFIGFNSIIFISALSGINPEQYEAATIDGAGRWKQMLHVTLPGIFPTITILFILQLGSLMNIGFDKIFLLYNPSIYENADVISTYVYRQGLEVGEYSYSAAVGIFNSVINFALLLMANMMSKRAKGASLF